MSEIHIPDGWHNSKLASTTILCCVCERDLTTEPCLHVGQDKQDRRYCCPHHVNRDCLQNGHWGIPRAEKVRA